MTFIISYFAQIWMVVRTQTLLYSVHKCSVYPIDISDRWIWLDFLQKCDYHATGHRESWSDKKPFDFEGAAYSCQLSGWYGYIAESLLYFLSRESPEETSRSEHKYLITIIIFNYTRGQRHSCGCGLVCLFTDQRPDWHIWATDHYGRP